MVVRMNYSNALRTSYVVASLFAASLACASGTGTVNYSGALDLYYSSNNNNPTSNNSLRQFDFKNERVRGNVVLNANVDAGFAKFFATLWGGDSADLLYDFDTAKEEWARTVRQFYVRFSTPGSGGLTIDLGKFDTPFGHEVADSLHNSQYGRGVVYTYGEPVYHSGVRMTGKASGSDFGLAVVQGWNESANGDNEPAVAAWVKRNLDSKTSVQVGYYGGREGNLAGRTTPAGTFGGIGFAAAGLSKVNLFNVVASHQWSDLITLGFDGIWAEAVGTANDGQWRGTSLYGTYKLGDKNQLGLRGEWFEDNSGVRLGTSAKVHSLTLTYNQNVAKNTTARAEFRRDWASAAIFAADGGTTRNQSTFTLALEVKF